MALYDQLAMLLHLLREALHICSPHGRLRTPENVRTELTLLFDMIAALDCAAITHTLKPIRQHIDDIVVPFKQAEAIDAGTPCRGSARCLEIFSCWPGTMIISSTNPAKPKRYHQREREFWLACAEGLLGDEFDTLKALVFDKLDTIVRASSLVEMVNWLLRPY